jgi:hypothetical protein
MYFLSSSPHSKTSSCFTTCRVKSMSKVQGTASPRDILLRHNLLQWPLLRNEVGYDNVFDSRDTRSRSRIWGRAAVCGYDFIGLYLDSMCKRVCWGAIGPVLAAYESEAEQNLQWSEKLAPRGQRKGCTEESGWIFSMSRSFGEGKIQLHRILEGLIRFIAE